MTYNGIVHNSIYGFPQVLFASFNYTFTFAQLKSSSKAYRVKTFSFKMSDRSITKGGHEHGLPLHEPSAAPPSAGPRRHHTLRTEATAFLGEFIGTFMFLSLAFSGTQIALNATGSSQLTQSADKAPDVGKLLYIAFAFGVSLAINVAIFADVSGGKFNPAVSLTGAVCAPPIFAWCNHNNFFNADPFFV
jgi:hypothetical protein